VAISRDGQWLLLRTAPVGSGSPDIVGIHLPDTAAVPLVATPAQEFHPALSPDGRWLAYASNESGNFEVYVRPFPETSSAKWQVSTAGGAEPTWSKDGRQLFYINGRNEMVAAEVPTGPTFSLGKQRPLFSVAQFTRTGPIPSYSLAPDGEHFLMIREGESTQQSELIVAENWLGTLKGK
jgi:Tol biopolymer transport system component